MLCPHCKTILNESLKFCTNCGNQLDQNLASGSTKKTIRVAKFILPPGGLFQSCISAVKEMGLLVSKTDNDAKYIESTPVSKSAIGNNNNIPPFNLQVVGETDSASIITTVFLSDNEVTATDTFDRLISILKLRLNENPIEADPNVSTGSAQSAEDRVSGGGPIRVASIILGILTAIFTIVILLEVITISSRLSRIEEIGFLGIGALVVARIQPSINFSGLISLLSIGITIILFMNPNKSKIVALLILSIVNILLSVAVISQIPQLLYELFIVVGIGLLLNIVMLVYSGIVYSKVK
jgi:hypothetical protein